MFSLDIVDTDAFLDMPQTSQLLYFHLAMRADDEGFIGNPKRIMRMIGAGDDDIKVLISKKFIIPFESGVCVIKHWLIHNTIRMDRFNPTNYIDEKNNLILKDNKAYKLLEIIDGCQSVAKLATQVKLSKDKLSKEEDTIKIKFIKPTLKEIQRYCEERHNKVSSQRFYDHYESNGWRVGRNPMKDWKAAVRTWEKTNFNSSNSDYARAHEKHIQEEEENREFAEQAKTNNELRKIKELTSNLADKFKTQ